MISKQQLRLLVETVLLESFKQDQRYLIEKYPTHTTELSKLQPKWISWLTDRFGESPTYPGPKDVTFERALEAIRSYAPRDAAMGEKYRTNDWWRGKVDAAFPNKEWSSPADPMRMTVVDMLKLVELSKLKKPRFEVDENQDIQGDRVGKIGPWNIWEASSRESSCSIIGVKPGTNEPKADICIAKTDSSNLFYNYAADYSLFTIMRDDPTEPEDILVIGFKDDGTPEFTANRMKNPTVDGDNNALDSHRLRRILGEHYDEIISTMSNRVLSRSGPSPARQKIDSAARNVKDFNDVLRGISKSEALALKQAIATRDGISPEVEEILLSDTEWVVRQILAANGSISHGTMMKLAQDHELMVRNSVLSNRRAAPDVLAYVASTDDDSSTLVNVARHPNTPPETLGKLILNPDEGVRVWAAMNKNTPPKSLWNAARRGTPSVRRAVAQNKVGDVDLLRYLADDPDERVRRAVQENWNTPEDLAKQIKAGGSMASFRQLIRRML
jgi:hypothetical protein